MASLTCLMRRQGSDSLELTTAVCVYHETDKLKDMTIELRCYLNLPGCFKPKSSPSSNAPSY